MSTSPYITLAELRNRVRSARKAFPPDHVAAILRDRMLLIRASEAAEIAALVAGVARAGDARLHDDGFEPAAEAGGVGERMPKRDRERAEDLARLLMLQGIALALAGAVDEAVARGREAVGWANRAGANAIAAEAWLALARNHRLVLDGAAVLEDLANAADAARRSGRGRTIVEALVESAQEMIRRGDIPAAETYLAEADEAVATIPESDTGEPRANILMARGSLAMMSREGEKAIAALRTAIELVDESRDPMMLMGLHSQLGNAYSTYGDERRNLESQAEVIRLAELHDDAIVTAWGYYRRGEAHFVLGDSARAEQAFAMSLRYAPPHMPLPRLYIVLKRAEIAYRDRRFDDGLAFCGELLDAVTPEEMPMIAVRALLQKGLLLWKSGALDAAEEAFRRTIAFSALSPIFDRSANARVHLAGVLIERGDLEGADALLEEVCAAPPRSAGDDRIIVEAYALRAGLAERRGDLDSALAYARAQSEHERVVLQRDSEQALQKARVLAEADLLEREAALERESRRRIESNLAQALLSLRGKSDLIETVERQLRTALEGITAEKAREITRSVAEAIRTLGAEPVDAVDPLDSLASTDPDFFTRLRARHPGLTPKQRRVCGLIRAGLTAQEIAILLGLGTEGLRAQRKRLRKTLGLESEQSLEQYITEI